MSNVSSASLPVEKHRPLFWRSPSRAARLWFMVLLTLAAVVTTLLMPPIGQAAGYHHFADQRSWLGVPKAWDVLSNAGFLVVGLAGLWFLTAWRAAPSGGETGIHAFEKSADRLPYFVFFAGVAACGAGSAYYHLEPNDQRLVWDRLPMTLAFAGFMSAVIAERIGPQAGLRWLGPLVLAGLGSVLHWRATELAGHGDLRPYALMQFYPMLAVPLLMLLFPARHSHSHCLAWCLGFYALAKVLELADAPVYAVLGVSGHTLKHLAATAATAMVLVMISRWRVQPTGERLACP
jgi:hypothetical protein